MVDVGGMSLEDLAEVDPSVVAHVLRGVLGPMGPGPEAVSGFVNDSDQRSESETPPEKPGPSEHEDGGSFAGGRR
ncbi:FxSxx-COOH cyclophane-containing RiPP peptide [Nocardiopsis protaetiae]